MNNRIELELHLQDELFIINLDPKSRKNVNIRIKPNNIINVSKPVYVSKKVLLKYLIERETWILEQSKKVNKIHNKRTNYISEETLILFGENCNYDDDLDLSKILLDYILSKRAYYDNLLHKVPEIKIKKMKGKWGYCVPSKNLLVFNVNLVHYPKEVVDYVILHEYTHLEIANHSKRFYDFIEKEMPDYKKHIKYLREH